jgi:proline iminopeptidase
MPTFTAYDGTSLAYHVRGVGDPLVCVPGGPGLDSAYLGDLGGLSELLELVLLDNRGTGRSAAPADPASYRCDRLVDDVEALRERLDLPRINLLGHSGSANVVVSYAARHPERIGRLVLCNPSIRAVGIDVTAEDRRQAVQRRAAEPWFGPASAAFERIATEQATDDDAEAIAPFVYGRWDDAARAHHASCERARNTEAAAVFGTDGAFAPEATRAALATLDVPVLLIAGEVDTNSPPGSVAEFAGLFPNATLATLAGGGHFTWLDDPAWVRKTVSSFWSTSR